MQTPGNSGGQRNLGKLEQSMELQRAAHDLAMEQQQQMTLNLDSF